MRLWVVWNVACLQLNVCWGCLPVTPTLTIQWPLSPTSVAPTDLADMITDAMRTGRQDERITLHLAPDEGIMQGELRRPRLGEDAMFSCEAPPGGDWRMLTWLHRGRTIFEGGHAPAQPPDPVQRYNVSRSGDRGLELVVLNVTAYSGGPVLCVDATPTRLYTSQPRILRRFTLLPLITRASEVFAPHSEGSAARVVNEGGRLNITCRIRLPLPEAVLHNQDNYFFWRYKGRIISQYTEPPYGALFHRKNPPIIGYSVATSNHEEFKFSNLPGQFVNYTLHLANFQANGDGEIQCFIRPHEGIHEWIFQTTTITVLA
ncbi:uncharacterized protein LOC129590021 [Paramacrobiotus metropolitanus]|uniref:uncharacterized protein LOC129590021 n=1 Tax=Paramacrobiotus metropolitanus TaxID=2943436 RepID=UPI002445E346|nr:uncharacterized protein LOC129590021 [Paramacrobiotus metropolitanus]